MNKKIYLLILLFATVASTGLATFTCWNRKDDYNTSLYHQSMFKTILEAMVVPSNRDQNPDLCRDIAPQLRQALNKSPMLHKNGPNVPSSRNRRRRRNPVVRRRENHTNRRRVVRKNNRQGPVVRRKGPVRARTDFSEKQYKCPVCQEMFCKTDMVELGCGKRKDDNGNETCHKMCKTCLQKLRATPKETIQNPDNIASDHQLSHEHPQKLTYSEEMSEENKTLARRYETATPEREKGWTWKKIGQYWYFLEDDKYWRYANDASALCPSFWRYICASELTPRCPVCREEIRL